MRADIHPSARFFHSYMCIWFTYVICVCLCVLTIYLHLGAGCHSDVVIQYSSCFSSRTSYNFLSFYKLSWVTVALQPEWMMPVLCCVFVVPCAANQSFSFWLRIFLWYLKIEWSFPDLSLLGTTHFHKKHQVWQKQQLLEMSRLTNMSGHKPVSGI